MSSNFSSGDMSDSESPGNGEVEPGIVRARIWKQMANMSPYPSNTLQTGNWNRLKKEVSRNRNDGAKEKDLGNKSDRARVRTGHATGN